MTRHSRTYTSRDESIEIYPSVWRTLLFMLEITAVCGVVALMIYISDNMFFTVLCYAVLIICAFVFIILIPTLFFPLLHIPLACIYEDRIESFVMFKMKYNVMPFADIDSFVIIGKNTKLLEIVLHDRELRDTGLQSSLVSHIAAICDLLNDRLAAYRRRHQRG